MSTPERREMLWWTKVAGQVGRLNLGTGRERREDLEHQDWQDPVAVDLEAPEPTRRTRAAASPHQRDGQDSSAGRSSLDSWKVVDEQEEGPEPKELFPAHDFPSHWGTEEQEIQTVPQDTDSSLDSGSETDDSVDTESDQEGVDIPELLRVIPAE